MTTLTIKKDSFLTRLFKRNRQEVGRTTTERPPQSKPRKFTRFIVSTGAWLLFSFGATAAINETSRHFTGSYVEELLPRVVAYHQDKNNGFEELKKALTNVHYTTDTSPQSSPSKWPILDKFVPVFPDQPARFYFDRETCLATRSLAFDLRTMKDYYAQRDEFDQYLKEQHSDPFVQERVDTINEVIQHAKKLGYTYSRCATINGFVNMAFPYNEKKRNAGSTDAFYDPKSPYYIEKWANSPQTTIEQNAICIGQAIMKAELLIRCGEKPENVFLLGIKDEKTPHAIVGVKDSENDIFILNNQMYTSEYCAKHNLKEIFSAAATIYDSNYYFAEGIGRILYTAINMNGETVAFRPTHKESELRQELPYDYVPTETKKCRPIEEATFKLYKAEGRKYLPDPSTTNTAQQPQGKPASKGSLHPTV